MTIKNICILWISISCFSCIEQDPFDVSQLNVAIPTQGNSWAIDNVDTSSKIISKAGISSWTDANTVIRTYFHVDAPTTIPFGIIANVKSGTSEIKVSYGDVSKKVNLSNTEVDTIYLGDYIASTKGYHYIDLQGIHTNSGNFGAVTALLLKAEDTLVKYIKDDFYFGRRGPSTHLVYDTPVGVDDIEWFYNEIEIDPGQDVIGSYFMANGFGEGYFGIQVNSETERRILFSIWSPYKTDDPSSIPDEFKINLLKKGAGVTTGKFGNEGSGGQSYKVFNWKAGTRYKFLTRIKPNGDDSTNYTAYFFDPETDRWHLIASFKRPKTSTYVTRPYSFLENFIPNTGALSRQGGFYNQWMRDSKGQWYEIAEAKFSADATARKDARLDYSGGTQNEGFYLMNCGFTNDHTSIGTIFKRTPQNTPPEINFEGLD